MLLKWLNYWPLMLEVWQRSSSCCQGGYITDHCYLRFDRGVVHAVKVVILLTIAIWGLTEEWFMLSRWLYYWPLLFEVWQRSGSCCWGGYITDHHCLRFDNRSDSCCWGGYITDHHCLRFDRGVVHTIQVVIWLTITIWQWHTSNSYFAWYLLGVSYQNIAKLS